MKRKPITSDALKKCASADFARLNAHLFGIQDKQGDTMTQRLHTSRGGTPPLKRKSVITDIVEQDPLDRCNKTERRFYDTHLVNTIEFYGATILAQAVRLPLDGGGVYVPDFFQIWENGAIAYEVKGGYRAAGWEQGYERFKRAALQYATADFEFILATFDRKKNEWDIQKWNSLKAKEK